MYSVFNIDIAHEMSISLLPLSFGSRPDPIAFLQQAKANPPKNKAVAQYLKEISQVIPINIFKPQEFLNTPKRLQDSKEILSQVSTHKMESSSKVEYRFHGTLQLHVICN